MAMSQQTVSNSACYDTGLTTINLSKIEDQEEDLDDMVFSNPSDDLDEGLEGSMTDGDLTHYPSLIYIPSVYGQT